MTELEVDISRATKKLEKPIEALSQALGLSITLKTTAAKFPGDPRNIAVCDHGVQHRISWDHLADKSKLTRDLDDVLDVGVKRDVAIGRRQPIHGSDRDERTFERAGTARLQRVILGTD